MNILLIRHADALPAGEGGATDDETRPLSETGFAQCLPLARAIDRFGARPQVVISSPLLRHGRPRQACCRRGGKCRQSCALPKNWRRA